MTDDAMVDAGSNAVPCAPPDLATVTSIVLGEIALAGGSFEAAGRKNADGTVEVAIRDGFGDRAFAVALADAAGTVRAGIVRDADLGTRTLLRAWLRNAEGPVAGRCFSLDTAGGMGMFLRALRRELTFHLDALPPPAAMIALSIEEIVARDPKDGAALVARLVSRHAMQGLGELASALFAEADPAPRPSRAAA